MKREILSMDRGWRFHRGDIPYDKYMWHDALYSATKTASSKGAARRDFDDSSWRILDVPHDYVVEGTPTHKEPPSQGSLPRPNAWYRKTFKLDPADRGRHIAIHFEGVASFCEVHVNGIPMMRNDTAGVGFEVDITDIARYGEDVNVVSVYCENEKDFEGWYYEGGGIYRHVWLIKTGKVHVDLWGTFVISEPISDGAWEATVQTEIKNLNDEAKTVTVVSEIWDPDGCKVAEKSSELSVDMRVVETLEQKMMLPDVKVWDLDTPNLYTLTTTIFLNGNIEDTYETTFGCRTLLYTASDGFYLNGRKEFILGYGSHQDSTGFGVGIPDSVSNLRMQRMKEMGFNMFRTAHNPFAPAVYEACDRIGLMCMDENRRFTSSEMVKDEVIRMVKRDRNHPSITMWSLFNEEFTRKDYIGTNIFRTLAAIVRRLDPTRPVTGADNCGTAIPGQMDDIDLIGINHVYDYEALDVVRTNNPEKPIYFSEEELTDEIRDYIRKRPYIFGALGWGGLPYRGETQWPKLFHGDEREESFVFNLLCEPMFGFYRNKALWTDIPTVKIVTDWTHPGKEGETITVRVYSNYHEVELFLNGEAVGKKEVCARTAYVDFEVRYMPGELKAVAKTEGKGSLEDLVCTAGAAKKMRLRMENPCIRKDGRDAAIITAYLLDEHGVVLPDYKDALVKFRVKKGGKFLCVGSPNRKDHSSWKLPEIRLYQNRAQVFVESDAVCDELIVEALCEGFEPAEIVIQKQQSEVVREVLSEENRFLHEWYISRTQIDREFPDIDEMHRNPDLNFWQHYEVGRGNNESFTGVFPRRAGSGENGPGWARVIYAIRTKVPHANSSHERTFIHFENYEGSGKVVVFDGEKRFEAVKETYDAIPFDVEVSGITEGGVVEVWAVLEGNQPFSAINRPVRWVFQ